MTSGATGYAGSVLQNLQFEYASGTAMKGRCERTSTVGELRHGLPAQNCGISLNAVQTATLSVRLGVLSMIVTVSRTPDRGTGSVGVAAPFAIRPRGRVPIVEAGRPEPNRLPGDLPGWPRRKSASLLLIDWHSEARLVWVFVYEAKVGYWPILLKKAAVKSARRRRGVYLSR